MASRRERRFAKRKAAQIRRARANDFPHIAFWSTGEKRGVCPSPLHESRAARLAMVSQSSSSFKPQAPKPKILAEDIGKLVDIGVSQKIIDCLYDGGFRSVGDLRAYGKKMILQVAGVGQARLASLEEALHPYGVTLPE